MNPRRLYRSRDRQLAGVAGGMAEYLDVDPTIIRIAWILVTIFSGGLALLAYLLLALVIPNSPYPMGTAPAAGTPWAGQAGPAWGTQPGPAWSGQPATGTGWSANPAPNGPAYGTGGWAVPPTSAQWQPQATTSRFEPARQTRGLGAAGIVGIVLVVIGSIALFDVVFPGLRVGLVLGPGVILALGVALLLSSIRRPVESSATASMPSAAPSGAPADAGTQSVPSDVPADMTPWPTTAAPTRPADPQPAQPDAATPTAHPGAYDEERTTVDPA